MDKLDEGRSRLIKSGGFFDEEFIIRLYMEMLVFMSCFGKTGGFRTLLLERRDCLATTRLMSLHVGKGQTAGDAVKRTLGYIKDPTKTENGILVTSYGCTPQEQREKIEMILKMLSLNEKEIFEDYFKCEKSAREIQQANGGPLEGIRAAIRRIRKKARLEEQGKNYFILCILGTLLIIHQIIK